MYIYHQERPPARFKHHTERSTTGTFPSTDQSHTTLVIIRSWNVSPCSMLKGTSVITVLTELPSILDKKLSTQCTKLIQANLCKETKTGFDYRRTLIHLLRLLHKLDAPNNICAFIETLMDISSLLYSREEERTM